jgi:hypothetical protein
MRRLWPVGLIAAVATVVTQDWRVFAFFFLLLSPIVLTLANLGCWRCFYNLLRPYGGATSIEHGDSWTTRPLSPWDWVAEFPHECPKCGALILSSPTSAEVSA